MRSPRRGLSCCSSRAICWQEVAVKIINGESTNLVAKATSTGKSEYTLCLIPDFMGTGDLLIEATVGKDTYYYKKTGGVSLTAGNYYQSTVTMEKPTPINLSALTAGYEAKDGDVLTGTLSGNYEISIADGATVKLDGVTKVTAIKGNEADNSIGAGYKNNSSCGTVTIGGTVGAITESPYTYEPDRQP